MSKPSPTARLEVRLPVDVHALLKRAAELQGLTLTDFVVTSACDAASRVIEEADIIRLSIQDQRQFADAILHPPNPSNPLRHAFQGHKDLLGH